MMRRRSCSFALALPSGLLLALLFSLSPWAASAQESSSPLFVERIDVDVVNVEVFVTDKQGNPVTDLVREDFEILEDGQPVEISNFFAVDRTRHIEDRFEADEALVESRGEVETEELPEDQRLRLAVYFDHVNLSPGNRNRLIDELEVFLEDRAIQGDDIMIVGYDRTIEIAVPFTRDPARVLEGLDAMRRAAAHRPMNDSRRRQIERIINKPTIDQSGSNDLAQARQLIRSYVQQEDLDLRNATQALGDVVRSLAGLPGRKALLYVSDGLAMRPGETLYAQLEGAYGTPALRAEAGFVDPFVETFQTDEKALFEAVVKHANANQVTFYPIDARGPRAGSSLSAEHGVVNNAPGGSSSLDALRQASLQEPLMEMAVATGGRAVLNTFSYDQALVAVDKDFDAFYSLGYRSRGGGDGGYHRIDVRLKRPGLRVRHREGFVDRPEGERVADRTMSSLVLAVEKNPLNVGLQFGPAEKQGRKRFHLPVLVRIPIQEVTLLPNGAVHEGRLRIYLAVQDEEGGVSRLHEETYPISIPNEMVAEAQGQEIGWTKVLEIRPGVPKVAVGVWDELSGTESFLHAAVPVGVRGGQKGR